MDPRITFRKAAGTVLGIGALLLSFAAPTQAAETGTENGPENAKQCIIVLNPLEPGKTASEVETHTCSTDANFATKSDVAVQSTLLMTWYANKDYGGASTQIRGSAGPCDSSGYGFSYVGDTWNDRISSFKTFNYCNTISGYDHANYGLDVYFCGKCGYGSGFSEPWVGSTANDRISSFWIKRW